MVHLNERQKLFCEYYLGECKGNIYQSALKAGYSKQYASGKAYMLLRRPMIQEYVQELSAKTRGQHIATIEEIKSFWSAVMNDPAARMSDRLKASEYLAKCEGEFTRNNW